MFIHEPELRFQVKGGFMIKGIGTDIAAIGRIREMIRKYGDHFLRKVFTDAEIDFCNRKVDAVVHFTGRWAAKEAFYKALPMSCQRFSSWKRIQIVALSGSGRPVIEICGDRLRERIAREAISTFHVSISHEKEYCIGFVVAE
jgi:holo-[acyl-carrier protein] synthase